MFAIGEENQLLFWITMVTGAALALGLGAYRCAKARVEKQKIIGATALLPLFAVFFSHLLYCLVNMEAILYDYSFGHIFAFWEKGHMVYGGICGVWIGLMVIGGKDRLKLLEQYAPSGALMVAAARIGEGFLGQGYGDYWMGGESVLCRFPFMVYDPYDEAWAWALFVLEALIALALLILLLKKAVPWQGDGALLFLGLYASAQIVLESLRRDAFLRWGFVRVEEVISAAAVLAVLLCYALRGKGKWRVKGLCLGVYTVLVVFCLLLEFATEGRIPFLRFLDVNGCYLAMAAACALLGASVLWMRRLSTENMIPKGKERRT